MLLLLSLGDGDARLPRRQEKSQAPRAPPPPPVLGLACWAAVGLATALSESGEALCGGLKVPQGC